MIYDTPSKKSARLHYLAASLAFIGFLGISRSAPAAANAGRGEAARPRKYGVTVRETTKALLDRVFGLEAESASIKYHVVELTGRTPLNAAIRSTLVPGWGQYFNQQEVKGSLFFLSTVGATAGSLLLYNDAQNKFDDYKKKGSKDDPLFDDYETRRNQSLILGTAAGILWVVNIYDAFRQAYEPLYSRNTRIDWVVGSEEGAVYWRRKF